MEVKFWREAISSKKNVISTKILKNINPTLKKLSTFNIYCQVLDANRLYIKNQFGTYLDYYLIPHYFLKCTNNTELNKTNCKP